jgi:hypothetical protein
MRMNFAAQGGTLGTLGSAFRLPLHIAIFPALSLALVVGVLALVVSSHSRREKKNRRPPGQDAHSEWRDFSDD